MTCGQPVDHLSACMSASMTTADDDPTHYLEDPELFVDNLPQPFRRINRIFNSIIDKVLEIAEARESKLIHDSGRRQAPQYDSANILEVLLHCFPTDYVFKISSCQFCY